MIYHVPWIVQGSATSKAFCCTLFAILVHDRPAMVNEYATCVTGASERTKMQCFV